MNSALPLVLLLVFAPLHAQKKPAPTKPANDPKVVAAPAAPTKPVAPFQACDPSVQDSGLTGCEELLMHSFQLEAAPWRAQINIAKGELDRLQQRFAFIAGQIEANHPGLKLQTDEAHPNGFLAAPKPPPAPPVRAPLPGEPPAIQPKIPEVAPSSQTPDPAQPASK